MKAMSSLIFGDHHNVLDHSEVRVLLIAKIGSGLQLLVYPANTQKSTNIVKNMNIKRTEKLKTLAYFDGKMT
jgi:hypothetical protein